MESLIAIALALTVALMVPGPSVVAVTTTALADRRRGLLLAAGVSLGDMIWVAASLAGVGALLANARPIFEVIRWLGVGYLLWFSWQLWRSAEADVERPDGVDDPLVRFGRRPFLNGVLIDLANPKVAIFYSTLFAALLPNSFSFAYGVTVLTVAGVITLGWFAFLALAMSHSYLQQSYDRLRAAIRRASALATAGFGARLALADGPSD